MRIEHPNTLSVTMLRRRNPELSRREVGKTFRRYPIVTVQGDQNREQLKWPGQYEVTKLICDRAKAQGIKVGGRVVDVGDPYRVWLTYALTPFAYLGYTIGVDAYRRTLGWQGETNPAKAEFRTLEEARAAILTYPWPGRTGGHGKGLDITCGVPPVYEEILAPHTDEPYPTKQDWADKMMVNYGGAAHELGHCFVGLGHESYSIMQEWWDYPTAPILLDHAERLRASPFFR